jgi:hypothetical protein
MKVKEHLSNLGRYLLIGIFFLGLIILFISLGGKGRTFNYIFLIIGFTITLPYVVYFFWLFYIDRKKDIKTLLNIEELKKNGNKIIVNLENVKIKTRNSYATKINNSRTGAINQIIGNSDKNIETIEFKNNSISFKIPYENSFIRYSLTIDMDPINLKLHFATKKETILYVDKKNMNKYYLDLEFLKK